MTFAYLLQIRIRQDMVVEWIEGDSHAGSCLCSTGVSIVLLSAPSPAVTLTAGSLVIEMRVMNIDSTTCSTNLALCLFSLPERAKLKAYKSRPTM